MSEEARPRIHIVFVALAFVAIVLIGKLFFVQVVRSQEFVARADDQYITPASTVFERGAIFFEERDGTLVSAATMQTGYLIAINPTRITDPERVYEALASLVTQRIDKAYFMSRAARTTDPYEEIAHQITRAEAEAIQAAEIPGVSVHKEKWRYYPAGRKASHVLGLLGYQEDILSGRYGVERYYDDVLSRDNDEVRVNFFAELFSSITASVVSGNNTREGDIVLTIEPHVQAALEERLRDVAGQWSTRLVGGIVIDPQDGRVYAMGSYPNFNPNEGAGNDLSILSNPLVEQVFEMGSIVKPLTVAAGLDAGVIRPTSIYHDAGYVMVDGARIENFDGGGRGDVSMQEVLNQSLNTGVVHIMRALGVDRFRDYMLAYGIGEETGIDLPGEVPGLVGNLSSKREIEYATASFGQGIAMSPIATVRALSALASGGETITPYVVDRIEFAHGEVRDTFPLAGERVLKSETAEEITRMLVSVVDDALVGGEVALPRYSIAAKTGTAQIANPDGGGYYDDRYLHSFFGYFPAYDPQFLVFLFAVHPQEVRYASQTLTDPFMRMAKFLLNYYNVPPDR